MVNEVLGDYFKKTTRTVGKKTTKAEISKDISELSLPLKFNPADPNQIFNAYFNTIKSGKYFRYVIENIKDPEEKTFAMAQLAWMMEGITTGAAFLDTP